MSHKSEYLDDYIPIILNAQDNYEEYSSDDEKHFDSETVLDPIEEAMKLIPLLHCIQDYTYQTGSYIFHNIDAYKFFEFLNK